MSNATRIQTFVSSLLKEANERPPHCREAFTPPIDAIMFINLKHRTDRLQNIQNTIRLIRPLAKTVHRIDAIQHKNGAKGCAMSHVKALELAESQGLRNVLVLEDDAMLDNEPETIKQQIEYAMSQEYDVVLCGSENFSHKSKVNQFVNPIRSAQTTTAYIVHQTYIPILRKLFHFCAENLKDVKERPNSHDFAIDQVWKKLQEKHKWFLLRGNPFRQLVNEFSDIEQKKVDYSNANKHTLTPAQRDALVPLS